MKQVVYVDVLVTLNIFISFFLLLATCLFTNTKPNRFRILGSSLVGGIYSLIIFIPSMPVILTFFTKVVFSSLMVLIAYRIKNLRSFFRYWLSFFVSNFAFAGIMLAIWFTFKPAGMTYSNGAFYLNVNALTLAIGTCVCYGAVFVISKFTRKNAPDSHICEIEIILFSKHTKIKGIIDTGNSLKDSFTGEPVLIVQLDYIKNIIPKELEKYFKNKTLPDKERYIKRLRLIPCNTVNGEGILSAIKSDEVKIFLKNNTYVCENLLVAVTDKPVSGGEYYALASNEILEMSTKNEKLYDIKSEKIFQKNQRQI